jgi:hypothetical protein
VAKARDASLLDDVISMLPTEDEELAEALAGAFEAFGGPRAEKALIDLLAMSSPVALEAAAEALGNIGTVTAVEPLGALVEKGPIKDVARDAVRAIQARWGTSPRAALGGGPRRRQRGAEPGGELGRGRAVEGARVNAIWIWLGLVGLAACALLVSRFRLQLDPGLWKGAARELGLSFVSARLARRPRVVGYVDRQTVEIDGYAPDDAVPRTRFRSSRTGRSLPGWPSGPPRRSPGSRRPRRPTASSPGTRPSTATCTSPGRRTWRSRRSTPTRAPGSSTSPCA